MQVGQGGEGHQCGNGINHRLSSDQPSWWQKGGDISTGGGSGDGNVIPDESERMAVGSLHASAGRGEQELGGMCVVCAVLCTSSIDEIHANFLGA